jgi:hypothetical protein
MVELKVEKKVDEMAVKRAETMAAKKVDASVALLVA